MSTPSKRLRFLAVAVLTIAAACNGTSSESKAAATDTGAPLSPQQVRTEVLQAVKAYADAYNRADVSAVVELYSHDPSATSVSDGDIVRGWENIRTDEDSSLTGLAGRFAAAIGSIDVTPLGSQYAMAVAPYTLTVQTHRGPVQVRGAISFVWQRADSGWKILHEHSSTKQPSAR